jgi:cell division transport system ATP-binding protein
MIRFDQVHKRYANGREALAGVSFMIEDGELAFLTGHSGAGKSSILKLIALIERPTRGQVFINNQNTSGVKPRGIPRFRKSLGMVFQDHKLLHDRPVSDNVALPLIKSGCSAARKVFHWSCRPANSSAWALRARSWRSRLCSLRMNPRAISIQNLPSRP